MFGRCSYFFLAFRRFGFFVFVRRLIIVDNFLDRRRTVRFYDRELGRDR